ARPCAPRESPHPADPSPCGRRTHYLYDWSTPPAPPLRSATASSPGSRDRKSSAFLGRPESVAQSAGRGRSGPPVRRTSAPGSALFRRFFGRIFAGAARRIGVLEEFAACLAAILRKILRDGGRRE